MAAKPPTRKPQPSKKKAGVLSVAVMALIVPGLFATVALPAYAFDPAGGDAQFGTSAVDGLKKTDAQSMTVDEAATATTVTRESYTATTQEELDAQKAAAEAAAAAEEAEKQRQANAASFSSFSGPTASDLLAAPPYPSYSLEQLYNVALSYQGVPYVYGGATPAGFDCSGFTQYVFAQFGIGMAHSSNAQGAMGTRISEADAVPGDLVVMPGHIGFYAGNGNILHAPYEGTVVRIQPIWTSDYYIVRIGI
ncbi:C40 family peptidase [Compostimonas suwonensis]|uniref:Cell wall-associated NlpC family hydrolase n=1 Tax=Compostimonas suwonensis TaxID=1048394 RepID=A0A2M9BVN2_9MICO|nr:C40 family peptidase [Compostimonas suwonensis]PJJ61985.1 cell wall-associated NlpC family hydrolase [Compostimonas suwonensis]